MENLKIVDVKQIHYCPRSVNMSLDECKKCVYFDGIDNDTVKCLKCKLIDFNSITVTSFTAGNKDYKYREYDEKIDGEITGDDPYDYCQKCDMYYVLPNGRQCCALRSDVPIEVNNPFICENRKIWKEVVKK